MPRMQFGTSAFKRTRGDLPELPVINMFAEPVPTEETGVVLQSRPGLESRANYGSNPIVALFQKDGVIGGRLFVASQYALYAPGLIGAIEADGPVSIDGYANAVFIAGGADLFKTDGVTISTVPFPDDAQVIKVLVGASRIICIRKDTQQFYWSNVLSSTIGALSFASAEGQPDRILDALFIDDILILFGAETVEFWPNTQDANLPFQPLEGRVFERGIKATGCAVKFNSTFAWITNTNQVCISDTDTVVSDAGLEAMIEGSSSVRLWTFFLEGTEFLAIRLDGRTWVYTAATGRWSEFTTYGLNNWRVQCYGGGLFGSATDGATFAWSQGHEDQGGVLERRWRAGFPITSGGLTVDNLVARLNVGHTPFLAGQEPGIEMRRSLDAGQTWGKWRRVSLGKQGQYRKRVQWTGLGMVGSPGLLCEFRVTDPVGVRLSDIVFNEPMGAF